MACANGKETAFGRIHDYSVCRIFQQFGKTRCALATLDFKVPLKSARFRPAAIIPKSYSKPLV